jgi:hypothetical protein
MKGAVRCLSLVAVSMTIALLGSLPARPCGRPPTQEEQEAWARQSNELLRLFPGLARPSEDGSHRLRLIEDALTLLWSGPPRERLLVANQSWPFAVLGTEAEAGPLENDRRWTDVTASLRDYLDSGEDHWILYTLVDNLHVLESPRLEPFFRDALAHPSTSIRERAARHFLFQSETDSLEILEKRWRWEEDREVRLALLEALGRHGSPRYADAFLRLARGEDEEMAEKAAWALAHLGDDRVRPLLENWVRSETPRRSAWALEALGASARDPALVQLALEASRSDCGDLARTSLYLLHEIGSPETEARLLELALWQEDFLLRDQAMRLVDWNRNRDRLPELRAAVARTEGRARENLEWALSRISETPAVESGGPEEAVPPFESGPTPSPPYRARPWPTGKVVPPPGESAVACLAEPGFPKDPEKPGTVEAGVGVKVAERFLGNGTAWSRVRLPDRRFCWLLGEHLEIVSPDPDPGE